MKHFFSQKINKYYGVTGQFISIHQVQSTAMHPPSRPKVGGALEKLRSLSLKPHSFPVFMYSPVRKEKCFGTEGVHFAHHLSENRFAASTGICNFRGRRLVARRGRRGRGRGRLLDGEPVELNDGSMLAIAHHGRLDDLPEGALLGRGYEQRPQLVNAKRFCAPWIAVDFSHALIENKWRDRLIGYIEHHYLRDYRESQREHGDAGAENVGEMVQEDEPIAQQ